MVLLARALFALLTLVWVKRKLPRDQSPRLLCSEVAPEDGSKQCRRVEGPAELVPYG